jgi:hypothetical protein
VAQGVQVGGVRTSGGRHATRVRYRGRHRKPIPRGRLRAGVRLAVTTACAALLVCIPQPSWADRTGALAAHSAAASQAIVQSLPVPVRQKLHD